MFYVQWVEEIKVKKKIQSKDFILKCCVDFVSILKLESVPHNFLRSTTAQRARTYIHVAPSSVTAGLTKTSSLFVFARTVCQVIQCTEREKAYFVNSTNTSTSSNSLPPSLHQTAPDSITQLLQMHLKTFLLTNRFSVK